jgi:hypothetical protein
MEGNMSDSMQNSKDLERLRAEVKAAWDKLPPDVQAQLEVKMGAAHNHVLAVQNKTVSAEARPPHRELAALRSVLHDNEGLLPAPGAAVAGGWVHVGPDGAVYSDVEYGYLDPYWARCFTAMVLTEGLTPPFKVGNAIEIPDNATLAVLGDWGGANPPALDVGAAAKADYLIHLGDVYYAGTNSGDDGWLFPYESTHFVDVWHGLAGHSFALNSNHEMYAHATGYSLTTLAAPAFQAQGGNCFALYNKAFRIVGLDSAYYAPDNSILDFPGYMKGSLGDLQGDQMQFLRGQIGQLKSGQNLILLTHHNGLNLDGSIPAQTDAAYTLWQQVTQVVKQLPADSGKSVWWYWGHEHAGVVYPHQSVNGTTIYPRCCGHGCIPWGVATELQAAQARGSVLWFEQQNLGPGDNYFVTNGYASLALSGAKLGESFWNQQGTVSWSSP